MKPASPAQGTEGGAEKIVYDTRVAGGKKLGMASSWIRPHACVWLGMLALTRARGDL